MVYVWFFYVPYFFSSFVCIVFRYSLISIRLNEQLSSRGFFVSVFQTAQWIYNYNVASVKLKVDLECLLWTLNPENLRIVYIPKNAPCHLQWSRIMCANPWRCQIWNFLIFFCATTPKNSSITSTLLPPLPSSLYLSATLTGWMRIQSDCRLYSCNKEESQLY